MRCSCYLKRGGKLLVGISAWAILHVARAGDFEIPQKFKPGDLISADVMNEVFSYIENVTRGISMPELVGTWNCEKYHGDNYEFAPEPYYTSVGTEGLWHVFVFKATFLDDGDGTYSWAAEPGGFAAQTLNACYHTGKVDVYKSKVSLTYGPCSDGGPPIIRSIVMHVKKLSPFKIEMVPVVNSTDLHHAFYECDKQGVPPTNPAQLTLKQLEGLNVKLAWVDRSSDETTFKIFRKDSLTGEFKYIGSVGANVTQHTDKLSVSGSYWYRVVATNAQGDSLGSNELKVTLEATK